MGFKFDFFGSGHYHVYLSTMSINSASIEQKCKVCGKYQHRVGTLNFAWRDGEHPDRSIQPSTEYI